MAKRRTSARGNPARPSGSLKTGGGIVPERPARYGHLFDHVVVGRRGQHRIDLRLARGSITETDARAIAIGAFNGVAPSGAAQALDARLGGAISDVHRRRMFSANVGEVFVLPTGRNPISAEFVMLVGLGSFDRMSEDVLQTAAENLLRTLVTARVEEFATVLFGGSSGEDPAAALRNLMTGFLRGLRDADKDRAFRRIVICERDADRYAAIKEEIYRLSSTTLCQNVELTFDEVVLAEPASAPALRAAPARPADPVYLIVRQEARDRMGIGIRSAVLTAGAKAAVVTGVKRVSGTELEDRRVALVEDERGDLAKLGQRLAETALADAVLAVLPRYADRHLVVVHDAAMSRIPWEALAFGTGRKDPWQPAVGKGISHRYAADNLSVAKWLEERVEDRVLSMLLVVNPTEDLDGAEREGERIRALFAAHPAVRLTELRRADATRAELRTAFASGRFDVIHYAGHAYFDEAGPERSGLVCAGDEPLTGADLAGLSKLPSLVFFNACESGRVRARRAGGNAAATAKSRRSRQLVEAVGLAEAFLRGGVANLIATYWPVSDAGAKTFAETFYGQVLDGKAIGDALLAGRTALRAARNRDWANYILYGDADFRLKVRESE